MMTKKVPKSRMAKRRQAKKKAINPQTIVNLPYLMIQRRIRNQSIKKLKKKHRKIVNRMTINWQRKTKSRAKATSISGKQAYLN